MFYCRGQTLSPDSMDFKRGAIKCKKTITNALPEDIFNFSGTSGSMFRLQLRMMRGAGLDKFVAEGKTATKEIQPTKKKVEKTKSLASAAIKIKEVKQQKNKPNSSRMKADYDFLEGLSRKMEHRNISAHVEASVVKEAQDGLAYLKQRELFWKNIK